MGLAALAGCQLWLLRHSLSEGHSTTVGLVILFYLGSFAKLQSLRTPWIDPAWRILFACVVGFCGWMFADILIFENFVGPVEAAGLVLQVFWPVFAVRVLLHGQARREKVPNQSVEQRLGSAA